ncbi:hypothetical protein D9615_007277 [Tricholomella constricta]|uniref:non-specific serine/threonine protein kinase n=1 Tax=Tricholomella constricta TaxID=117010 RepID=A0A8H5H5H3_9AGAR|nr:hypothetical protein D9615_007277 [Tricholomella constricta]
MTTPEQQALDSETSVVRVGRVRIKGQGSLSGWAWRAKPLILTDEALVIPGYRIPLDHITKVERVDLKPYCLLLEVKNRTYHLSFENDGELYDWQDDVYSRCPLIGVGTPQDFVHNVHVGFDQLSNSFSAYHANQGLPSQWSHLINPGSAAAAAAGGDAEKIELDAKRSSTLTANPLHDTPSLAYTPASAKKDARPRSPVIMDGSHAIKVDDGFFTGWLWKARWLVLSSRKLTIYRSQIETAGFVIDIGDIKKVEVVKARRLRIETKSGKRYFVSFRLAEQASAWRSAISSRVTSALDITHPWNFKHNCHVGFDPVTGEFTGLPKEWRHLMEHPSLAQAAS